MSVRITMIAVVARDGGIGRGGDLLWHLPGDLKHFKSRTMGRPVIMGRKTWESLPKKPLPGRLNIVVTRNEGYSADGAVVAGSLDEAFKLVENEEEAFVMGGASIYEAALPYSDRLELTEVDAEVEDADTKFPHIERSEWIEEASEQITEKGLDYRFVTLRRR